MITAKRRGILGTSDKGTASQAQDYYDLEKEVNEDMAVLLLLDMATLAVCLLAFTRNLGRRGNACT